MSEQETTRQSDKHPIVTLPSRRTLHEIENDVDNDRKAGNDSLWVHEQEAFVHKEYLKAELEIVVLSL